ncbi:MAG: HEPN domain-containing protein [Senegalia sp. (in: firmicutes)]|uniref:HEPN domain-containing protein n=1 Tax=Senegalia sp. (in: firmicutes) TaxID=1924098 RepID=UPI003F9E39EF
MNNEEKYEYWLDIAKYDLETAEAMFDSGRYLYVVFMCQQSIEKLVKGLFVLKNSKEPPRIHNILNIFEKTFDTEKVTKFSDVDIESYFDFFDELLAYYISERYPSYKNKLSKTIDKNTGLKVLNKSKEVFKWLKSLKTLNM